MQYVHVFVYLLRYLLEVVCCHNRHSLCELFCMHTTIVVHKVIGYRLSHVVLGLMVQHLVVDLSFGAF
jgi:hypothetical protein